MGNERASFLDRFGLTQTLRRWTRAMQSPGTLAARDLKAMHGQMRAARDRIDALAATAETELLIRAQGEDGIDRPDQCDWAERATPWRQKIKPRGHVRPGSPHDIGGGLTLFHDATEAELSLRQDPVPDSIRGPAFGLVFEVYRFDGSFLSLVQDLPEAALRGLTLNHFIAVHLRIAREQPVEVYARLNVQHGPNLEQIVRQFEFRDGIGRAEFDLAYSKINEKRLEKAWLDLIFEGPEMNRLAIWDMVVLRAPRADI
ncbi:DUF6478 family protein [Roseicyclus mahoneyensis]|uniref:Uncharacterized protein n=1 Tax=Roseicyclus mahoneyensis TaxID=164332 RepID=A0A316GKZ7_9RHOB|nr:DUF6478 family protein [Roseicyclus mahoneyensis]PWK61502.1 hypothetical protein C7455_102191 [Roseicyclus mahoneyensis]